MITRSAEFLGQIDAMPWCVDLFAGLGGWTDGFLAEGYRVTGYDIEAHEYGEHRYPAQLVLADVRKLHGSAFKDAACIVASPPCQEFSYMAMPWSLAKAKAADIRADETGEKLRELNALFNACFRIQREACEAAGHHIPMVVENVRGAIPWVGRSRWNFGSFHLWGDVPALMPQTLSAHKHDSSGWNENGTLKSSQRMVPSKVLEATGKKVPGIGWNGFGELGYKPKGFNVTAAQRYRAEQGTKNSGGSWFNIGGPGQKVTNNNPVIGEGRKGVGSGADWFDGNLCKHSSKSDSRKAASAMIAKIPEALSRHIARTFYPR